MNIIHIIPNLVLGGAQRLAIDIAVEQSKTNQVLMVLLADVVEFNNVPSYVVVLDGSRSLWSVDIKEASRALDKVIVDFSPDIIHSHLYLADAVAHYHVHNSILYVTHVHDNIRQYRSMFNGIQQGMAGILEYIEKVKLFEKYKRAKKVFIPVSYDVEKYLIGVLPKSLAARIHMMYNAVNVGNLEKITSL